jgi:SNF2 family DNA or RNA helicase
VTAALTGAGLRVVRYDGSASAEAREDGKRAFQVGDVDVIVGNQRAGGRGIDLSAASWVMYYSHDWGLRYRLQSEDRAQSLRRTTSVLYLDVVMEGTVDEKILKALRDGKSLSDVVMGETSGEWL